MLRRLRILLVLSVASQVAADPRFPIKTFQWENDDIFVSGGVDRYYTNGLRLTLIRDPDNNPDWVGRFRRRFCDQQRCRNIDPAETSGYIVGHSFFTPERIEIAAPQPFDRPFAGWLYGGVSVQITDKGVDADTAAATGAPPFPRRQDTFEATVGVLGPAAGARRVQTTWHDLPFVNGRPPRGWHNQLRNEPTLQINYQQSRRYGTSTVDVVPNVSVSAGTVQTFAGAGFVARVGKDISGFGIPIIPTTAVGTSTRPDWEVYGLIGADARFVLHNAFLDGGFFRRGPSVDRENVVSDVRAGVSGRYKSFRLTYTYVRRSREFSPAPVRGGSHRFASIAVSIERELRF